MSISFSGLASGLDTSSWVESLTALKRAKVETYQAEKEKLELTQQTLASIKNFFNSFRSVIEKVTDSKFGLGSSLDIFSQNIATSSKANIVTATANSSAQEGVYNIIVNNLASNTQASSGYYSTTTQTVTATATSGSTLNSLGVKAGKIGVTVNGIERTVRIGNDETIQSFIEKLGNVGAQASYNESTGIFNVNLGTNDIRDIDNTGIVNALHLKGVNEGYTSNSLQKPIYETVTEQATATTRLSELGIQSGNIIIASPTSSKNLYIGSTMTLGALVESFTRMGYDMALNGDGSITLNNTNCVIQDGSTGLLKALGWDNPDVTSSSQTSKKLQYSTTIVEGSVANSNTKLADIATVNDGDTVEAGDGTITLSATSTIGDLITGLNNKGLYANIDSNGVVRISDGSILGGTFDIISAFNLTEQVDNSSVTSNTIYISKTIAQNVTSTANITYTAVRDIQLTDNVVDFCPELSEVGVHLRDNSKTNYGHGEDSITFRRVEDYYTFQDLLNDIKSMGVDAKLENGIITLTTPENTHVTGLEALGINVNSASSTGTGTVTIASTRTSGTLYYTATIAATSSDNIADFVECNQHYDKSSGSFVDSANGMIIDSSGRMHHIYTSNDSAYGSSNTKTFQDLFDTLASYGIVATMNNGVIHINSTNGAYVSGDLFEQLGIQTVTNNTTTTVGASIGSTQRVTYTQTIVNETTKTVTTSGVTSGINATNSSAVKYYYTSTTTQTSTLPKYQTIYEEEYLDEEFKLAYQARTSNDETLKEKCNITILIDDTNGSSYYTINVFQLTTGDYLDNYDVYLISGLMERIHATCSKLRSRITDGSLEIYSNDASVYHINLSSDLFQHIKSIPNNAGQYGRNILISSDYQTGSTTVTTTTTTTQTFTDSYGEHKIKDLVGYDTGALSVTIRNKNTGETTVYTYTADQTVSSVGSSLHSVGMTTTMSNGYFTINPSGSDYYICGISDTLRKTLNLEVGEGKTYTVSSGSSYTVQESTTTTVTATLGMATTFGELGLPSSGALVVIQNGTSHIITIGKTDTVEDLVNKLRLYNINAGFGAPGMFTISSSSTSCISAMDSELKNALGINTTDPTYYKTVSTTGTMITNNKKLTKQESSTIDGSQTISSAHAGTITINYMGGKIEHIYVNDYSHTTYNEVLNELKGFGINATLSNGQITFTSSDPSKIYIIDFGGAFGMSGNGYTTSVQTSGTKYNTPSDRLQKEETLNANWDTTLEQISSSFTTDQIVVKNSQGQESTISINKDDSLRDIRNKLAVYNIAMDVSNGKVTFSGTNGAYIDNMDDAVYDIFQITGNTFKTTITPITSEDGNKSLTKLLYKNGSLYNAAFPDSTSYNIYLYENGNRHSITVNPANGLNGLATQLAQYGMNMSIDSQGRIQFTSSGDTYISADSTSDYSKALFNLLGIDDSSWEHNTSYQSSNPIGVTNSTSQTLAASRDTKLSDLGVTTGEYLLYKDGVKHTLYVSSDDTLGDFLNTIRSFGIESSLVTDGNYTTIKTNAVGDTYIKASSATDSSNIIGKIFNTTVSKNMDYYGRPTIEKEIEKTVNADEDTKLSDISTTFIKPGDNIQVTINGESVSVNIDNNETVGSLLDKFNAIGINASFAGGKMILQSGFNSLTVNGKGLTYNSDLGGYSASNNAIKYTEVKVEQNHNSVANYANDGTTLELLNITDGTLSIFRNGEKATIDVDSKQTFGDLKSKISAKFSDVYLRFENGNLIIGSDNAEVLVGTTTDSSNFAAITGMHADENKNSKSSRALYCVNNDSKVTASGLFARKNVTTGNFKVGNATINIDNDTTIDDIISQINYNDASNATAYWDSIDGKFVIKSKSTGASMINIEAGDSNFTEVMGFTYVENGENRMNMKSQTLGQNARFTINGTNFTSTSNTVTSDVSRIEGVTLNLKDISNGEAATITIEKDKETVANAMSDIVDAYNELIENVDKEVARGANLSSESTLKLIRNQIRSLMTSSLGSAGTYKNLASIGISLNAASSGNIRTDNINQLGFDKEKFTNAFKGDLASVKNLLVGKDDAKGILTQVEDVLEQALGGVTGYFASSEKSYNTKISRLDDKINKANKAAERYKTRLEAKFKSMDMIISKFQNQYSSFLGT